MLTFTWPNVTTRKSDGLIQTYKVHTRVHSCTCSFKLKTNCEHETKHVRDILTLMTVGTFCKRHWHCQLSAHMWMCVLLSKLLSFF